MFCATTALNQLCNASNGANRLVAMTGAKHLMKGDDFVSFKLPKAVKGINYVKITLCSDDTYEMELGKTANKACPEMKAIGLKVMLPSYSIKKTYEKLFCTDLKTTFECETGLYLSL